VALIAPHRFSHACRLGVSHAQVAPVEVARLSHVKSTSVTGAHKSPLALLPLSFFVLHLFNGGGSIGDCLVSRSI
jgi:hypothetical protein